MSKPKTHKEIVDDITELHKNSTYEEWSEAMAKIPPPPTTQMLVEDLTNLEENLRGTVHASSRTNLVEVRCRS